uniref:Glutaredoxin-2, mitochondrial n=1 Tax=Eptatretus burgeri TaxID=7764 RepID=A0A8C4QC28_EPTBU
MAIDIFIISSFLSVRRFPRLFTCLRVVGAQVSFRICPLVVLTRYHRNLGRDCGPGLFGPSGCRVTDFRQKQNAHYMGGLVSHPALVSPASAFIENVISNNCVVIFSKSSCPFCVMANRVFEELGSSYATVELDCRDDGPALQQVLIGRTGMRTVPQVFVNGNLIGGGSETKRLYAEGKLHTLVMQCAMKGASAGPEPGDS